METPESDFDAGFGGPGPEDFANGAAALAAGLVREAQALSATAAALRATATANPPGVPGGEALSDVRRQRVVLAAAGDAAVRAALAIEAAALLGDDRPAVEHARRMAEAAKRVGLPAGVLAPMLRAAALDFRTDDAAARIAASTLAADLCAALAQGGG
jgi:predicted MFS family arabinose efflux permease